MDIQWSSKQAIISSTFSCERKFIESMNVHVHIMKYLLYFKSNGNTHASQDQTRCYCYFGGNFIYVTFAIFRAAV